ncbi:uncharacterized protein LOC134451862 [Engraulis encrasicolus]|uniref:uncharacterized protein LOC134451862 n=1 Tax=Engraulis encrasicolus TaxID=184585 RepID=UPI002FCEEA5D
MYNNDSKILHNSGLYGKGILELPLSSLTEEYKSSKVRLEMMLTESRDPCIAGNAPTLATGRKWTPAAATHQAKSSLKHRDIVGHVQRGRGGLGLGESKPAWCKASPLQRRGLVVEEIRREEQAARCARAISQGKQGRWMCWEDVEKRKLSWKEIWDMEASRTSFLLRATYDVLPSPANLSQWYGEDPTCHLCSSPANLKHIMVGCKTSLAQGRYTWRHNQVLRCLAASLESRRMFVNSLPPLPSHPPPTGQFVREGEKQPRIRPPKTEPGQLAAARDWRLLVDLEQRLCFPAEIAMTNLRPDLVLWSASVRRVYIVELTVPWEDNLGEAFERKKLRYAELAADAEQQGWKAIVLPVEVGCRGFVGRSVTSLLKDMGIRGQAQRQSIKALARAAEKASQWLWIRRRDNTWAPR